MILEWGTREKSAWGLEENIFLCVALGFSIVFASKFSCTFLFFFKFSYRKICNCGGQPVYEILNLNICICAGKEKVSFVLCL